jgi:metal-responsive CopG/Arc/MetJ family transcriptional regulator
MWSKIMNKTVIQVPMDKELLDELDNFSSSINKSRAEIIRQACRKFIKEMEEERLDRLYQEGYRRIPETTEMAESQVSMLKDILPEEKW